VYLAILNLPVAGRSRRIGKTNISPNEQYVTLKGFEEVKERARKEGTKPLNPVLPLLHGSGAPDSRLTQDLESSESDAVRECWHKAVERVSSDPAGGLASATEKPISLSLEGVDVSQWVNELSKQV
jgi:hypothetical protein